MKKISRRRFLHGVGLGSLALLTPYRVRLEEEQGQDVPLSSLPPTDVFGLAVASGDPTPSGVILWTRVNPWTWVADTYMVFQLALSANFNELVVQGVIGSEEFGAERDYTVKVDVDGLLSAGSSYYYRFIYRGVVSQTGQCRTLPALNSAPEQIRLAVVACQFYGHGYYGAFQHLAQDPVDFVIHLGDFIYEYGDIEGNFPDRAINLPSGATEALNLTDFRYLYRLYRTDPFLQEVMARHTFIVIWDDHETADDCYWDYGTDAPNAPEHPYTDDAVAFRQLKLDSQRAWAEYVPARPALNPQATHPHDYLSIWRSFRFGDLIELFMTDERTYRSPHPCGEETFGELAFTAGCAAQMSPERTMLGEAQRDWLINGLVNSTARWKLWGNQSLVAQFKLPCDPVLECCADDEDPYASVFMKLDSWDGYAYERQQIAIALQQANIRNTIVLTGDMHLYMSSFFKVDYDIADNNVPNNIVGVEFATSSVTSGGINAVFADLGIPYIITPQLVNSHNPHVVFYNSVANGYAIVNVTRYYCDYTAYYVDRRQQQPVPPRQIVKRLRVPRNQFRIYDLGLPDQS